MAPDSKVAPTRILIVDDDFVDREHIKRTLLKTGTQFVFVEAETVDEALASLRSQDFDLVLLDYRMPCRSGIEMLAQLREERRDRSVAVIMLSNSEDERLAQECVRAGAQDFILKADLGKANLRRAILNAQTRFELERQLYRDYCDAKQLAEHDSLTGLANRFLFEETLKINVANSPRGDARLALLLFDLDHFKQVNDNYGHDVGDLLLKGLVERINRSLRGNELFARLGGDEFAIVLTNLKGVRDVSRIAKRILKSIARPIDCAGTEIKVGISLGISIYPDNSQQPAELFKFADIALYRAKNSGRNRIVFFEDALQQQFLQRHEIEHRLKSAIGNDQLRLQYQPLFEPRSMRLTGFEALLRWQVDDGLHLPDAFIDIAEDCGQIHEIGRWVITRALEQHQRWLQGPDGPLTMSINLSAAQFRDPELIPTIRAAIERYRLPPRAVEFEVTETALIANADEHLALLNAIGQLGCRISLDDFGTGYSSVTHLQRFPIDTVKVDRSLFLARDDEEAVAMIRGLTAMTHSLGLAVVAEGVENQGSLALCRDLRIERAQGYYFSRALPAAEIEKRYLQQASPRAGIEQSRRIGFGQQ